MRYVLDLSEDQAKQVSKALELYARLKIGQWRELSDLCLDLADKDFCKKRDALESRLLDARKIAYPELCGSGHSYGIGKFADADSAWEIHEVLRNKIAWTEHPEGGAGVAFSPPYSFRGNDLANCSAVPEE